MLCVCVLGTAWGGGGESLSGSILLSGTHFFFLRENIHTVCTHLKCLGECSMRLLMSSHNIMHEEMIKNININSFWLKKKMPYPELCLKQLYHWSRRELVTGK